jgi:tRNA dimethylallyltransferase
MRALVILGPTAAGKGKLARETAKRLNGEIVSVDSRKSYKYLDIGTAKPTSEQRKEVKYHLIDLLELYENNNAETYAELARGAIRDIHSIGKMPILVGGAGLYFRAIFEGLFKIELDDKERRKFKDRMSLYSTDELYRNLKKVDSQSVSRINPNDRYRIVRALEVYTLTGTTMSEHISKHREAEKESNISYKKIGLELNRKTLYQRINERTVEMLQQGWTEEVEDLINRGVDTTWPGMQTLGYPEVVSYVQGKMEREEMIEAVSRQTRKYAKRQLTWFAKEEEVSWINVDNGAYGKVIQKIHEIMDNK